MADERRKIEAAGAFVSSQTQLVIAKTQPQPQPRKERGSACAISSHHQQAKSLTTVLVYSITLLLIGIERVLTVLWREITRTCEYRRALFFTTVEEEIYYYYSIRRQ